MRRPHRRPAKASVISAVCLCVTVLVSGCSASSSAGPGSPTRPGSPAGSGSPAAAGFAFTVTGVHPVPPNGSQDTHAQTPDASCDTATFASDRALGVNVIRGFTLAGLPASADLLQHFLDGTGTAVHYRAGSLISKEARASASFLAVNDEIQAAILSQLKTGRTRVGLSAAQLPTVASNPRPATCTGDFAAPRA
jgi:hypothetical protein